MSQFSRRLHSEMYSFLTPCSILSRSNSKNQISNAQNGSFRHVSRQQELIMTGSVIILSQCASVNLS